MLKAIFYRNRHFITFGINRYRRKLPKVDASIFDSALSHTRRSGASEKREENSVSTFGQIRLWTSFEASAVLVKIPLLIPEYFSRLIVNFLNIWKVLDKLQIESFHEKWPSRIMEHLMI